MKITGWGILFFLLVSASVSNAAMVYKWVEKDGSVHFADDLSKVPPEYRNQVQAGEMHETLSSTPAPAQRTSEEKRDAQGRGEQYWRETVQPWKNQLKQAQEDYDSVNLKIEDALEMVKGRFYSHTQYNLKRLEVEQLMAERGTYEAKMKEANEMLAKIAKEAEEAKADPAWLQ